jgi:hypothetical protein
MAWEPLKFTDYDVHLIQSGLGKQKSRLAAVE